MANISIGTRIKILNKSNGRCFYCGDDIKKGNCEIDHFLPFSIHRDGTTDNLVASCKTCNRMKSNGTIEDLRVRLEKFHSNPITFFFERYGISVANGTIRYSNTLNIKTY